MSSWREGLTAEQIQTIEAILPGRRRRNGRLVTGTRNGWTIFRAPTTGRPRHLSVRHREDSGRLVEEIPILVNGELAA
jgi:hypothetical protein